VGQGTFWLDVEQLPGSDEMTCHSLGVRLTQRPKVCPNRRVEPPRVDVVDIQLLHRRGAVGRTTLGRPGARATTRPTGTFGTASTVAMRRSATRPALLAGLFAARTLLAIRALSTTPDGSSPVGPTGPPTRLVHH